MAPPSKSKKNSATEAPEIMIVNDVPGEECRIAILQNDHLEELYTERAATATDVGNIYKGKVVNVEPAIQAAFIDYGEGANGFLHISDLHPKYFPGEERTERVGKKIPRRDRPPIQAALRRGDEILVQVLKEGIGTKGPTLTSYLSIPGRLLVMMPDMDRVGVSRKVEDEEKRRAMREILDSLNLPDGFGFILRTAGFGKTKTELKRDAAYLLRLWKVMEKRIKGAGAPCELYTESDLLIRTIRDVLRPTVTSIVVDSASAYDRVNMFLSVVAPRSAPSVLHYRRPAPIFHAFDIERQIELIHAREVPLPSGGRLVIDQTEALVAIDVNSGRSRSARDSETNAYETNIEAADEICRQLRLRDLGGLIVNDLIDMRSAKHRAAIEERFTSNLKRDRARSTIAPISEFGILEMTRQRMRPSLRKSHFMPCPHCDGHGEIKAPDSVAADAVRHIGYLLQYERVQRVDVACSPRVASVLLSNKRRELVRLEDDTSKRVDVRVSETIAPDRVDFYAYDDRHADIDLTRLPPLARPSIEDLTHDQTQPTEEEQTDAAGGRKGRRRRGRGPADATAIALAGNFHEELKALGFDEEDDAVIAGATRNGSSPPTLETTAPEVELEGGRKRKRRRRRRGRRGGGGSDDAAQSRSEDTLTPPPTGDPALASPVRIHELAKELRVSSSELMQRVEPDPNVHHVTSPLASVTAEEADVIRHMFAGDTALADQRLEVADGTTETGQSSGQGGGEDEVSGQRKRRRRRRRRGKGNETPSDLPQPAAPSLQVTTHPAPIVPEAMQLKAPQAPDGPDAESQESRSRRRRRRRRGRGNGGAAAGASPTAASEAPGPSGTSSGASKGAPAAIVASNTASSGNAQRASKRRRSLYGAGRVAVSPRARSSSDDE